jgi:hypothetical protein
VKCGVQGAGFDLQDRNMFATRRRSTDQMKFAGGGKDLFALHIKS